MAPKKYNFVLNPGTGDLNWLPTNITISPIIIIQISFFPYEQKAENL